MSERQSVKEIEIDIDGTSDLALIASDDSVWLVTPLRWWDFATVIWWLLVPSDKRARVRLSLGDERVLSVKAVRVATKYVRLRGRLHGGA
jgi:hypothetical protein